MGPTWDLSAPDGPHVGPMNLAMWEYLQMPWYQWCYKLSTGTSLTKTLGINISKCIWLSVTPFIRRHYSTWPTRSRQFSWHFKFYSRYHSSASLSYDSVTAIAYKLMDIHAHKLEFLNELSSDSLGY